MLQNKNYNSLKYQTDKSKGKTKLLLRLKDNVFCMKHISGKNEKT